jgi:hypothetical protein
MAFPIDIFVPYFQLLFIKEIAFIKNTDKLWIKILKLIK